MDQWMLSSMINTWQIRKIELNGFDGLITMYNHHQYLCIMSMTLIRFYKMSTTDNFSTKNKSVHSKKFCCCCCFFDRIIIKIFNLKFVKGKWTFFHCYNNNQNKKINKFPI